MLGQTVVSLLILGICLIIIFNANNLVTSFFKNLEVGVFLNDDVDELALTQIERHIKGMAGVGEMQYISKEDAYKWMEENSPYDLKLARKNPFPASLKVKVFSANDIEPIAKEIGTLAGVDKVEYAAESLGRVLPVLYFIQVCCFFLTVILAGMTLFSITNSIKLAIHARRQEIKIMRLVGATDRFIRWPFVMEGMFYGFLGALGAFLLASGPYAIVMGCFSPSSPWRDVFVETGTVTLNLAVLMFVIGTLVGAVGSLISVEKHLATVIR